MFTTSFLLSIAMWQGVAAQLDVAQIPRAVVATQNLIDITSGNPGITFSAADFRKIQLNTLRFQNPTCIQSLRYGLSDADLTYMKLADGNSYSTTGAGVSIQITNLNDFRKSLADAACCGHVISFCYYTDTKKMLMLNVFPCQCVCKK